LVYSPGYGFVKSIALAYGTNEALGTAFCASTAVYLLKGWPFSMEAERMSIKSIIISYFGI